ncbi:MAG: exosome complex RNA-binding protein Rrp4 [Candidatus Thermoplasmatota archaeon]
MAEKKREIVIPSQLLGEVKRDKPGSGTFVEKGKIYAENIGILNKRSGYINVVPLKGKYNPIEDDLVIGIVDKPMSSCWLVDINGPYPALLHVNEVPWDVDFNETTKYLNAGDCIMAKVSEVDHEKKVQITMNDRNLAKINEGLVIDVEPTKIPRIIGRKGSMIQLLKKYTRCRVKVGRNGRIWVEGNEEGIEKVRKAIRMIEDESLSFGLTDRVEKMLKNQDKN